MLVRNNNFIAKDGRLYMFESVNTGSTYTGNLFYAAYTDDNSATQNQYFNSARFPSNTWMIGGPTPTQTIIKVRPNIYEPGRANIIIYNPTSQNTVNVDISSVLQPGDT